MPGVLVVCTGNVCRSPIAEGMLRSAIEARFGGDAPRVRSAGTMGWVGSPAEPNAVEAAAERGVDISDHRARALEAEAVRDADLVLGMGAEHVHAVSALVPEARERTFALKELVPLLERLPPPPRSDPAELVPIRVAGAAHLRAAPAAARDVDVDDPLGLPLEAFRAVAADLESWCGRLVEGLFGPPPDRATTAAEGRER